MDRINGLIKELDNLIDQYQASGTAVNCEKEGHCYHSATSVGSLYCCKCGKYLAQGITYTIDLRWINLPAIVKYDDDGNFIKVF